MRLLNHEVEKAREKKENQTFRVEEKSRSLRTFGSAEGRGATRRKKGFVTKNSV
jgi:hypothetical protein